VLYAIGDIHGELEALEDLIEALPLRSDDRLIFMGDYVDRGPDSRGVVDYLVALAKEQDSEIKSLLTLARATVQLGSPDKPTRIAAIRALAALPGRAGDAAAELAAVERMASGPAAAIVAIEALGLDLRDSANEAALRALANDLVVVDRADRAIASVDRALRARPESASALSGRRLP